MLERKVFYGITIRRLCLKQSSVNYDKGSQAVMPPAMMLSVVM
jgi:hypothetical protein